MALGGTANNNPGNEDTMMWGGYDGWGWWSWMGVAHGAIWWVLLLLGIIVLVRWIGRSEASGPAAAPRESALDILKKRYAEGAIGREEFEQKKRDLDA